MIAIKDFELTSALNNFASNDILAQNATMEKIYHSLYRLACRRASLSTSHDLTPTILVHESFLKLFNGKSQWTDRDHFISVAATAMRQISIDYIRSSSSVKRGGAFSHSTYSEESVGTLKDSEAILRVNDMLESLQTQEPELVTIIELKFFVGLTNQEVAESTGKSLRTVNRKWDKAKEIIKELY